VTRSRLADAVGAGLLLLVATAIVVSAQVNDAGNPWPALAVLILAATAYAAGRLVAPVLPVFAGLVLSANLIMLFCVPSALSGQPSAPPLGYANADAALYVQTSALAAMAALAAHGAWRAIAGISTSLLVVLAALIGSLAGFLTGSIVLVALLTTLSRRRLPRRTVLTACLGLVLAAHVAVLALGVTYRSPDIRSPTVDNVAAASLSARRLSLWSDAITIAAEHPVTGVGPRTFPTTSPTARAHPDTREAHSATLQMAAEAGWPCAVLLLCLFLWATARALFTMTNEGQAGAATIAATSAAALAVHSTVDYVLNFPVLVATAAVVLGAGTAGSWALRTEASRT
jgi:O-antigen ligase